MGVFGKLFGKTPTRDRVARQTIDLSPPGVEGNATYDTIDFVDCDFIMSDRWPQFLEDCTFTQCRFELSGSLSGFRLSNSDLVSCHFHFKRATKFMVNRGNQFDSCTFTGRLEDSVFGSKAWDHYRDGWVRNSDFRELSLDDIAFRGAGSEENCSFPSWPIIGFVRDGEPLPPEIVALPKTFHDKIMTDFQRLRGLSIVDVSMLDLDRETLEAIAQKTDRLRINS